MAVNRACKLYWCKQYSVQCVQPMIRAGLLVLARLMSLLSDRGQQRQEATCYVLRSTIILYKHLSCMSTC